MNNITEHIKSRRSVRTYDGRELSIADIEKLASFRKENKVGVCCK